MSGRLCECGCGTSLEGRRRQTRFHDDTHRKRYERAPGRLVRRASVEETLRAWPSLTIPERHQVILELELERDPALLAYVIFGVSPPVAEKSHRDEVLA
jgi:hypothetical protein